MGQPIVRKRALERISGTSVGIPTPPSPPSTTAWSLPQGSEITHSEGHPFHSNRKVGKFRGDLGGPFYNFKQYPVGFYDPEEVVTAKYRITSTKDGLKTNIGPFNVDPRIVSGQAAAYPPSLASSDDELKVKGTTAISICNPGNPAANASTFIGELFKEGLPSLVGARTWKDRTNHARNAGDEYLNVQFGWLPLVNDVSKFGHVVRHADTVLAQYERDSGKIVRRNFKFPTERTVTETSTTSVFMQPLGCSGNLFISGGNFGTKTRRRVVTRDVWFSGAFTYYLPSGYDNRNQMHRMALLADRLGLSLTPDTLWNLAPWSWAVDWFTNAGDVVNNVSRFASAGLILRYGYIMEHTVVQDTYTQSDAINLYDNARYKVKPTILVTETKKRLPASPFGFGVTWDGLSSFQASIAAALGLSRSGR